MKTLQLILKVLNILAIVLFLCFSNYIGATLSILFLMVTFSNFIPDFIQMSWQSKINYARAGISFLALVSAVASGALGNMMAAFVSVAIFAIAVIPPYYRE